MKDKDKPIKITDFNQFWGEFEKLHKEMMYWLNGMQMIHEKHGFGDPKEDEDGRKD